MGLGSTDLVSLAEAREKALACRRQLLDGIDPIEARQSRKAARKDRARRQSVRIVVRQDQRRPLGREPPDSLGKGAGGIVR